MRKKKIAKEKVEKIKNKKENILNNITLVFLFLIPIFSTTYFHSSYVTLFEVIVIFGLFIATLIIVKDSRKNFKYIFLYYVVCLIYLLISYLRADSFNSLVPGNFNYSVFDEALTILKLVMPITFIYSLYYQRISWKKYLLVLKVWVILISGSIIITNIFKISLSSYSDAVITKNIFEWNINNYYQETASKGLFMYANQEAVVMLMLLLVFVYDFLYKNKRSIFYIFLLAISMLMLGTRVSSVGGLLTLICAYLFYCFYFLYKKEKFDKKTLFIVIPILLWILLIPISPYANRNIELNSVEEVSDNVVGIATDQEELSEPSEEEITNIDYVYNNYNPNYLPKVFFEEYYPVQYDSGFWREFIENTPLEEMNYRTIETSIIKRVVEINDDSLDILFGISNSRIQNIVNIERDFVLHYYAFGIIGSIILLLVYILMLIYSVYNFFKYQTFYLFIFTTVIVLFIFSAYLTGNIINSINAIIPFSFIISGIFMGKKVDK